MEAKRQIPLLESLSTFVRLVLTLVLIVGLIFVTVWGLKIVWEKRGLTNNTDEAKPIKVLNSTYLAPRKAIHLVEVGNRILVLGVGNDEITRLDVITDPAEVESIRQSTQVGFPNVLDRLIHREVVEKTDAETQQMIAESNETVGGYVEKLKRAGRKRKSEDESSDKRASFKCETRKLIFYQKTRFEFGIFFHFNDSWQLVLWLRIYLFPLSIWVLTRRKIRRMSP